MKSIGSPTQENYVVNFSFATGSSPLVSLYFDGILDKNMQFANLIGTSSLHLAEFFPTVGVCIKLIYITYIN